jgi:hypothetical protein
MDSRTRKELRSLLRLARKDRRKPLAGYVKEGDGSIHGSHKVAQAAVPAEDGGLSTACHKTHWASMDYVRALQ